MLLSLASWRAVLALAPEVGSPFRSEESCESITDSESDTLRTLLRMDPQPEQNPMEAPSPVPQPMMMERSLSSESGSNSSVSTVYFTKASKSGSASSSRSGSAASTSRSPPDHEAASRPLSWQSPSAGQGEGHHGDDKPREVSVVPNAEEEKKNDSTSITKEDNIHSFEQTKGGPTVTEALKKGADNIVSEVKTTETLILKDVEQATGDCCSCCSCCRSCTAWGLAGDVAAVLCCPFTVISLLSCMCFRCPKLFATKASEKLKGIKRKGEEPRVNREESELESTDTAREASPRGSVKHTHSVKHHDHHHEKRDAKPEPTAKPTVKSPGSHSEKMKMAEGFNPQQSYFFPSPGVEDDHPGGDKAGGR